MFSSSNRCIRRSAIRHHVCGRARGENKLGFGDDARAMATRCCWPPKASAGGRGCDLEADHAAAPRRGAGRRFRVPATRAAGRRCRRRTSELSCRDSGTRRRFAAQAGSSSRGVKAKSAAEQRMRPRVGRRAKYIRRSRDDCRAVGADQEVIGGGGEAIEMSCSTSVPGVTHSLPFQTSPRNR